MKPFKKHVVSSEVGPSFVVELVGGPLCGNSSTWAPGERYAELKYYGGLALYELEEGERTAVHRRG